MTAAAGVGRCGPMRKEAVPRESGTLPQVGVTGLEPVDVNYLHTNDLQGSKLSAGAESGALGADLPLIDADLQAIVDAWPALPEAVRAGILAMIEATA